jgi:outer membrane protein assembly factor BamB
MEHNRREFLANAAGLAAAGWTAFPALAAPKNRPRSIKLPAWTYGDKSAATDTVLMFRGNAEHTFYGTGPIPDQTPKILWRYRTASIRNTVRGRPTVWSGTGWTGTAVKLGGYVYVGSVGGYVYAFEANTGRLVWRRRGGGMFKGSICAFENRLYIGNTDNLLRCIDAETGRVVWRHDTGRDLDSSPCVVGGRLYIAGENGYARCLDPRTGKLIWKCFVGGIGPGTLLGSNGSETSPAISGDLLYTATYDGDIHAIDIKTGKLRWKTRTGDDTDASVVVDGDFIYACAEERASFLYCFTRTDGREIWRYGGNKKGYWSTPAVANGRIWVGGEDGRLHCVDAANGTEIWTFPTGNGIWSSPCVVDGRVIFGSRDFNLYCVDAETGSEVWRVKLDGRIISSPCIVDGKVWIGTATGYFYCLGT